MQAAAFHSAKAQFIRSHLIALGLYQDHSIHELIKIPHLALLSVDHLFGQVKSEVTVYKIQPNPKPLDNFSSD